MINISKLQPIGRKLWVKKRWDEYERSRLALAIRESNDMYLKPYELKYDDNLDRVKWKTTVDKKVDYLLARPPVSMEQQDELDDLSELLRESAKRYLLDGSLIWIVQGDGVRSIPQPMIMVDTIAIYGDKNRQETVAIIRKFVDIEIDELTGAETEIEYFECYYTTEEGTSTRETYCFSKDNVDKVEVFDDKPLFIELAKTGDTPLFAYISPLIKAFDEGLKHQDKSVEANADPIIEVRGYSGTSDEDLKYALDNLRIARTDGTGGITIHSRSMDSSSIDLWMRRVLQEYYEATMTVGKESELAFAQSGKALDRLFVDAENSARQLAGILGVALEAYFKYIGVDNFAVTWNTDRPTDDAAIVAGIQASQGILSRKTLLEQHPWVDDVDEELERISEEEQAGYESLMDMEELERDSEELEKEEVDGINGISD